MCTLLQKLSALWAGGVTVEWKPQELVDKVPIGNLASKRCIGHHYPSTRLLSSTWSSVSKRPLNFCPLIKRIAALNDALNFEYRRKKSRVSQRNVHLHKLAGALVLVEEVGLEGRRQGQLLHPVQAGPPHLAPDLSPTRVHQGQRLRCNISISEG